MAITPVLIETANEQPVLTNGGNHVGYSEDKMISTSNGTTTNCTQGAISPDPERMNKVLQSLYSPSTSAKIWGVALRALSKPQPPRDYPEYTEPGSTEYVKSSHDFWTSGFFPGCLYALYERRLRWPNAQLSARPHMLKLRHACDWWTANLYSQASRRDTHDLGFMIQPWARPGWELNKDQQCFDSMVTAAHSLASRYNPQVGCIRSWDSCVTKRYSFTDLTKNYLVIIDNMMNLNLIYYVAKLTGDQSLSDIATAHADRTMSAHIRADNSTCHLVDFDQQTGEIRDRLTNQGFSDESCWARGQAWGITGFAQTYGWTGEERFLDASKRLADYFISELTEDCVPYWDFDAPRPGPRDTSAGLIAAYGMLLIHEYSHAELSDSPYLQAALRIIAGIVDMSLAPSASFVQTSNGVEDVDLGGPETIILNATINNYEFAPRRWADHGLVYADYYFLLIGNKLLELGIASL